MSLIYEGGATQGATQMSQALATGTQQQNEAYKVQVSAQGGEGLWNIAQETYKQLQTEEMRKSNSVESIYMKLEQDAVLNKGFKAGSADGQIPGQFQGNQKSGRDLDLIYANDKFSIQLDRPAGVPQMTKEHLAKYDSWKDKPQLQQDWNTFAANNKPLIEAADKEPGMQLKLMEGFESAQGKKQVEDYTKLVTSDDFKALPPDLKQKTIDLSTKGENGSKDALTIIQDKGFKALAGKEIPARGDTQARPAQAMVLDTANAREPYRKALLGAMSGTGDFKAAQLTDQQRGENYTFMAMYTGRERGYDKWGGDKPEHMDDGARGNALKNLWNDVLTDPKYVADGSYTNRQYDLIGDWVGKSGYHKPGTKPDGLK